jgi:hypothetical protein
MNPWREGEHNAIHRGILIGAVQCSQKNKVMTEASRPIGEILPSTMSDSLDRKPPTASFIAFI